MLSASIPSPIAPDPKDDGQEAVVVRISLPVADDLLQREIVQHLVEQRSVVLLKPAVGGDVHYESFHPDYLARLDNRMSRERLVSNGTILAQA